MKRILRFSLLALTAILTACTSLFQPGKGITGPIVEVESPVAAPLTTASPFLPEGYGSPTATTAAPTLPPSTNTVPAPTAITIPTDTPTPLPATLWISPAVPPVLREAALATGILPASDVSGAIVTLDIKPAASTSPTTSTWFYALVAPFPTVIDNVSADDIRRSWAGELTGPFAGRPLWMDDATADAFTTLWGAPAAGSVQVVATDQLLDSAWANQPAWGIIPFEQLEPRWKVLSVDGISPIHIDFNPADYPLVVQFLLQPAMVSLPATNRDLSKMTTLVMTGVTAMVRATASRMENKGITYPGEEIRDWLASADITHISNEIPFTDNCPKPDPYQRDLLFCSNPSYIELLDYLGADVVELTGNHLNDYGSQALLSTLNIYDQHNIKYYGGGTDLTASLKPLTIEHNGNKLAFIGCNPVGPEGDWATNTTPGSAPCGNYDWMIMDVARLRSEGYLPIVTFQYYEYYTLVAPENQVRDFGKLADAGAAIISGSQSHFPMNIEFKGDTFIHYGLGNLFFDQMNYLLPDGSTTTGTRRNFIDRYVIYNNKVVSVELLTTMLEDYARPRPMTEAERTQLLEDIFAASGWR
jgi:poly-gamma-glutamate capsule biosynthesis protein CapA/YwtB (metallophosphatase superfamily)